MTLWKPICTVTLGSLALVGTALILPLATRGQQNMDRKNFIDSTNGQGISRTITTKGTFELNTLNNPFFRPLGTNGRTCATCHPTSQGMTISPDYASQVFDATQGLDPLFAAVDGANNPDADMSTPEARRSNCSMLLTKGLIRIGLALPANCEFTLEAVDDPYHYAGAREISCFRRPLPSTNLRFLATVMWDGRERPAGSSVTDALKSQIKDAVSGHMQGIVPPTDTEISQILDFETHLYTTQIFDNSIGNIDTFQIGAGPQNLIDLLFHPGINDAFGLIRNKQPFNPNVFTFYTASDPDFDFNHNRPRPSSQNGAPPPRNGGPQSNRGQQSNGRPPQPLPLTPPQQARFSVARGENLFNTRQFDITDVPGLNDVVGKTRITGTCSSCHSVPRVGSNALPLLLNTGVADGLLRTADLPLYTLRNKKTGAAMQTTDPGAAMTSGKWADIGKFKVPSLRALETQSPYFHNGFSGDLLDIVNFYDNRFLIGLTDQEKADLKAFLTTM